MHPLTLDDIVPLAEYAARRQEFWEAHRNYRSRYRRVAVGPELVVVFENRQTLWFRVQEILRLARIDETELIQQELDWFNQLLPGRDQLHAGLIVREAKGEEPAREWQFWSELAGQHIRLQIGKIAIPSLLRTCRPSDRAGGTAGWLEFSFSPQERARLADFQQPLRIEAYYKDYRHSSGFLSNDIRQSLLEDLELADRRRAA
ncbi:MAG TPA: DUF3501 family protein [Gemmataceae bacterium]|jgi:hypothetical protein|nr:DUF3501 family protein [Gemmataceae bacterium]